MSGLTTAQAAALCEVETATVRGWIKRGKIKRGRRGLIDPAELLEWWDRRDVAMADLARSGRQQ